MSPVTATWTGYIGSAADGTLLIPGATVTVDRDVAEANPHYTLADTDRVSDAGSEPASIDPSPVDPETAPEPEPEAEPQDDAPVQEPGA